MPLTQSDIQFRYSNVHASGPNNDASNPPSGDLAANCIGRFLSMTPWQGGVPNDLFDNITGAQNVGNRADYRCFFVVNLNTTKTLYNAVIFIPGQVAGGADCQISLEYSGSGDGQVRVVLVGGTAPQAITLTNSTAVPNDLASGWKTVFSEADGLSNALEIGDIPPGQCCPVWVRRQARNSPPLDADGLSIRVEGDSPE